MAFITMQLCGWLAFLYNFLWLLSFIAFLFENFEGVRDGIWDAFRVLETPRLKQALHLAC